MDEETKKLTVLEKTELGERLKQVKALYASLTAAQETFCEEFGIHCVSGCGTCCEHFTPDITNSEAEYLALGLISAGREEEALSEIAAWNPKTKQCPLYRPDHPYHCSVYAWRPMICRLFGAAASVTKEGKPAFRHCKWNPNGVSVSPETMEQKPEAVVVMSDYAMKMEQSEVGTQETELIPDILPQAIAKVQWMLDLAETEEKTSET